jgi:hypothetical protein
MTIVAVSCASRFARLNDKVLRESLSDTGAVDSQFRSARVLPLVFEKKGFDFIL